MTGYEPGTVATARLNGKVRLLRYLPDDCPDSYPWVMDPTYDRADYVASNWRDGDSRLVDFAVIDRPKPEEPTGLGAVVEDAEGKRWTRYDERDVQPWWRASTGDPDEPIECRFAYDDIDAVRVLSEGVAP